MLEKLKKAKPAELQAWMWSAFIFGVGLGALLSTYIRRYAIWIILVALPVHLWAMCKIYIKIK